MIKNGEGMIGKFKIPKPPATFHLLPAIKKYCRLRFWYKTKNSGLSRQ